MFTGKKFVFIGKFKQKPLILNNQKITKKRLMQILKNEGGKDVTGISNRTDYIIFPDKITNRERTNKQIDNLKKIYNPDIQFLSYKWLLKSLESKKILPFKNYKIKEFYDMLPINSPISFEDQIEDSNKPFYEGFLFEETKCWKEFVDDKGNLYYYNVLTGTTCFKPPSGYKLFGPYSILKDGYYTKESVVEQKSDIDNLIKNLEDSLKLLEDYEKNIKSGLDKERENRKRKRKDEIVEFENVTKKMKLY